MFLICWIWEIRTCSSSNIFVRQWGSLYIKALNWNTYVVVLFKVLKEILKKKKKSHISIRFRLEAGQNFTFFFKGKNYFIQFIIYLMSTKSLFIYLFILTVTINQRWPKKWDVFVFRWKLKSNQYLRVVQSLELRASAMRVEHCADICRETWNYRSDGEESM